MLLEERSVQCQELQTEVDRILQSEEFRNSEVIRRLLIYLTEQAVSGAADHLKEYTVAVEGLGKPASYDPQHNSAVRIQVGRLRQKLAEYYRAEGKDDEVIVTLPKGRFRLTCEHRQIVDQAALPPLLFAPPPLAAVESENVRSHLPTKALIIGLCSGLLFSACLFLGWRLLQGNARAASGWTPDLEALWAPFITSQRPLILSIEDPLFVEMQSNPGIYYRDRSMNDWTDVQNSPGVKKLSEAFGKTQLQPSRYYTAFGESDAAFRLGQLLGTRKNIVSMARSSQISWQQLADNNIVFVGVQNLFFEQLLGMPVEPELVANLQGVRNTRPAPGEPAMYVDQYTTAPSEQGVVYALVTHVPGPRGSNDVESFTSIRSPGYVGAVQFFTDPKSAHIVVQHLKEKSGGEMPRSYQVLLKISFKDDVPTKTTYVLSRILH
jgi:hypothetical protein